MNFKNTHGVSIQIFKLTMRHFEYSWSDVIGILNIHKVTSWEYSKADVMGILEFSWSDVMGILNIQKKCNFEYVTWIFWIILNIHKVMSWVFWIFKRSVILNMNFKIPMTLASEYFHNVTSWVFKIPMTSPYEYSKYQWGHFIIPMTSAF